MNEPAKDKKAKPTPADKDAARRLKAIWNSKWKSAGRTQKQFLEASGIDWSASTVSQYLGGTIPLNYNALMVFAKTLGFDAAEVRTDLPEQSHIAMVVHPVRSLPDDADVDEGREHRIDTLAFELSAGSGRIVPTVVETLSPITYRDGWFRANHAKPDRVKRVRIDGDSMEPTLYDGDYALIHLDDTRVVDGRVYAIIYGNDRWGRIKRLYTMKNGIRIVSDNPDKDRFPDEILEGDAADEVKTIGRVIDKSGRGGL